MPFYENHAGQRGDQLVPFCRYFLLGRGFLYWTLGLAFGSDPFYFKYNTFNWVAICDFDNATIYIFNFINVVFVVFIFGNGCRGAYVFVDTVTN